MHIEPVSIEGAEGAERLVAGLASERFDRALWAEASKRLGQVGVIRGRVELAAVVHEELEDRTGPRARPVDDEAAPGLEGTLGRRQRGNEEPTEGLRTLGHGLKVLKDHEGPGVGAHGGALDHAKEVVRGGDQTPAQMPQPLTSKEVPGRALAETPSDLGVSAAALALGAAHIVLAQHAPPSVGADPWTFASSEQPSSGQMPAL